jgi:hypothetical protein
MSSSVRASTSSPGLLLFASREEARVALIFVPLEMLAESFPSFAFADVDDAVAAEVLLEACAPELLVCMEVWDCPEAPACPEAVVFADVAHAPSIPMASNESIRFI